MDILTALRLLQKARTEDLQSHHDEVLLMLADVSKRLKSDNPSIGDSRGECISIGSRYSVTSDGSAGSSDEEASDSENSVTTSHNTPLSGRLFSDGLEKETGPTDPSTRDSEPPQDPVLKPKIPASWPNKLFESFADTLQWLYTFSRGRPGDIIKARRMEKRDRRIEDIRRVEGSKLPGKSDQFFKGIAQRSMGLEYTNYQLAAGEPTRVSELCEGVRYTDSRLIKKRPGIAKRYLTSTELESDEKETILRGINVGVKQLVLEELFGRRLQESGRSNLPSAISAFTALNANAFIHLRFEDFPQFIDLILPPQPEAEIPRIQLSTGPNSLESFQIPDVLVSLSRWFSEFQIAYDADISSSVSPEVDEPPRKRVRLGSDSRNSSLQMPGLETRASSTSNRGENQADRNNVGWSTQRSTPNGTLNETTHASLHTASMTSDFVPSLPQELLSQGAGQKLMDTRAATSLLQSRDILEQDVTNWQPFPNSDMWWGFPNSDTGWHDTWSSPFSNLDTNFFYNC